MRFGLFYEWPNPDFRDWRVLLEEGVEQIQYSETLGFDYCLIAERHFTNYGNSPAPLLQAMYIGRRTRRIGIGTASVILPMWQPLRLAEEVAVLDNLLDGRFMCGVGCGYQPYEMVGFGADVGESRARFDETLDVLLKAWTSDESFTYEGELDDASFMDRLFFGSPETVTEKLKKFAAGGATHVSNWMMFGGIEHEKLMRSIRLMGEEVIPALRDTGPSPLLAEQLLSEPITANDELQAARLARSPKDMET